MPVEFVRETCTAYGHYTVCDSTRLVLAYDGSGRCVSKTRMKKTAFDGPWYATPVMHYTGIGTEVRENFAGPAKETKVVVNMPVFFRVTLTRLKPRSYIEKDILRLSNGGAILPKQSFGASRQGLGRYGVEDASDPYKGIDKELAGYIPSAKIEWYLKNHLGSTMLVYSTAAYDDSYFSNFEGGVKAAYDYRAFGEQIDLVSPSSGKVTENFTGKEKDDETELDFFGARYLDPMLGMWTSVDPARQFASPYLYAGNGYNPVNVVDPNGNYTLNLNEDNTVASMNDDGDLNIVSVFKADGTLFGEYNAPPAESYFFTENLANQVFDPNMQLNADAMVKDASQYWPLDFWGWRTKGPFDFKNSYYFGARKTVGVLNNTIMTARDAGNAIWGGWARHMYLNNATAALLVGGITPAMLLTAGFCSTTEGQRLLMQGISNIVATNGKVYINGSKEDPSSAVMQDWGFGNYKP